MTISAVKKGDELTIQIEGRFDFYCLQDFRKIYEENGKCGTYVLDMAKTDFLDSSALGMLLTLRDYAGGDSAKITIVNASDDIKKIISVTKLDELFKVM